MIENVQGQRKTFNGDQVDENNRFHTSNLTRNNRIIEQGSAPSETIKKLMHLLIKCIRLRRYGPRSHQNMQKSSLRFFLFRGRSECSDTRKSLQNHFLGPPSRFDNSKIFPIFKTFENSDTFNGSV